MSEAQLPGWSACRRLVRPRVDYLPRWPHVLGGGFVVIAKVCGLLKVA